MTVWIVTIQTGLPVLLQNATLTASKYQLGGPWLFGNPFALMLERGEGGPATL